MVRAWREKTSGWVDVYMGFVYLGFIIPKKKYFEWSPPWHFKAYISHMFWHSIWHSPSHSIRHSIWHLLRHSILDRLYSTSCGTIPNYKSEKKNSEAMKWTIHFVGYTVYPISLTTNLLEMVSSIEDPTVTIQCRIIFEYPIFSRIFRLFPSVQLMRGPCWRLQNCRDTLQNLISGNKIHQESSRYPKLDHHSHFVDHAMVCCHSMTIPWPQWMASLVPHLELSSRCFMALKRSERIAYFDHRLFWLFMVYRFMKKPSENVQKAFRKLFYAKIA